MGSSQNMKCFVLLLFVPHKLTFYTSNICSLFQNAIDMHHAELKVFCNFPLIIRVKMDSIYPIKLVKFLFINMRKPILNVYS